MRVMHLTDFYHPVIGGLERYVATLSRELVQRGHPAAVVTLRSPGLPAEETIDGVRVIRIGSWSQRLTRLYAAADRPFHPTMPDPGAMGALRRIIQRERPDVVHSHSWLQYSCFPLHRAHDGPAHVVTLHDYGLACPRKTLQRNAATVTPVLAAPAPAPGAERVPPVPAPCPGPRLARCLVCAPGQYGVLKGTVITASARASRLLHGRADRYIAISDAVAEGSRPALPRGTAVVTVPSLVPDGLPAQARQAPRPAFLPDADGYLMFAGALGPHKGLHVLLEARRRMRHQVPLVVAGTPHPDAPPLTDPGVTVAYNVPSAQVMAAWARSSVAVVPSVWSEPVGLVAIEAMLAGRPVVASAVGGLREIVRDGRTGFTVPPGDPGALAAALDILLDDPARRRRMGHAGRDHARRYEASAVTPCIVEVYEAALLERALRER